MTDKRWPTAVTPERAAAAAALVQTDTPERAAARAEFRQTCAPRKPEPRKILEESKAPEPDTRDLFDRLHIEAMTREWFADNPPATLDGYLQVLRRRLGRA